MKNNLNNILRGKRFGEMDYNRINNEELERIKMAYNNVHSLTSMLLVYLSSLSILLATIFSGFHDIVGYVQMMPYVIFPFVLVFTFLCGIPACLIVPSAVKYGDNLRGVISLAAYNRVFHELPSLMSNDPNEKICAWETLHLDGAIPKAEKISIEYRILSFISLLSKLCC